MQASGGAHPLFRWLAKLQLYQASHGSGEGPLKSAPSIGFAAAALHLGYSLHLLAHHDQVPKLLLRRLRDPATFFPAFYEALVGAAFAVAGFEISVQEVKRSHLPSPEFRVRSKGTGKRYVVEAKLRSVWSATAVVHTSNEFRDELAKFLRRQLRDGTRQLQRAADRSREYPILWIELALPFAINEASWRELVEFIDQVVRDIESRHPDKVDPTYLFLTNHSWFGNEDAQHAPTLGVLLPFNIPDFVPRGQAEVEVALAAYDRHRDIISVAQLLKVAGTIPVTFDGTPEDLLDSYGRRTDTIKIGDRIAYAGADGQELTGVVEEVAASGEDAVAAVRARRRWARSRADTANRRREARRQQAWRRGVREAKRRAQPRQGRPLRFVRLQRRPALAARSVEARSVRRRSAEYAPGSPAPKR
jgi:hypothetical protein